MLIDLLSGAEKLCSSNPELSVKQVLLDSSRFISW